MNVSNCSAYELIEESKILDLNSTGYLLRHKKSGARVAVVPWWHFWKMMMRIKCLT